MDFRFIQVIQFFSLSYLANKDASIVHGSVVKHLHVGNGRALKKKATPVFRFPHISFVLYRFRFRYSVLYNRTEHGRGFFIRTRITVERIA